MSLDGADLSVLRAGITGAAPMPPAIGERFREMTGRTMHEIYGMTEASGLIAIDAVASGGGEGAVASALPKPKSGIHRLERSSTTSTMTRMPRPIASGKNRRAHARHSPLRTASVSDGGKWLG